MSLRKKFKSRIEQRWLTYNRKHWSKWAVSKEENKQEYYWDSQN